MADKETHSIRNGIIIVVVSSIILSLIPQARAMLVSFLKSVGGFFGLIWRHLISTAGIPWGLLWLLAILSIPTLWRLAGPLLRRKSDEPKLKEYVEDRIFGVAWRWSSISGAKPIDLAGFCPYCGMRLVYKREYSPPKTAFFCEHCQQDRAMLDGDLEFATGTVEREIERRVNTGEWKRIVGHET